MLPSSPPRDRFSRRALFGSGFGQALHEQLVSFDDARPWRGRATRPTAATGSAAGGTSVPGAAPAPGTVLPDVQEDRARIATAVTASRT
jgi:hypothetical protein